MPASPVSVIIPTYNRAHLIGRSVESALAGVRPGDEVLVVDDGSTDDTAAVLAGFGERIRYLNMPHGGAGATRNAGIRAATRPLVAFLDSDDLWYPDKLDLQRAVMDRRPDVLFSFTDFGVRTADGTETRRFLRRWHNDPRPWSEILGPAVPFSGLAELPPGRADFPVYVGSLYAAELERDYVATFTLVARREEAGDALRFAEDVPTWEDWECFGRLAQKGPAAYLDCETAWQCGHRGFRLSEVNEFDRARAALTIMPRVWGADPDFMARHGDLYERRRAGHHLKRAQWLIRAGRMHEARDDLKQIPSSPLSWRLLSRLPGPVVRGLLGLRRAMRPHQ
jgi:hypothetical protein